MNESMNSGQLGGDSEEEKTRIEKAENYFFRAAAADFKKIPGSPIAYWVSERMRNVFERSKSLEDIAEVKHGLSTGKNEAVVRLWPEVSHGDLGTGFSSRDQALNSKKKWFPYNKGGDFRKWYGNCEFILRYDQYGNDLMASFSGHRHDGKSHYFKEGVTWTFISSSKFAARYTPIGFVFDVSGSSLFVDQPKLIVGFLCTDLCFGILKALNPTLNFQVGNLKVLPIDQNRIYEIADRIDVIADRAVSFSKKDWDCYEISWEFKSLALLDFRFFSSDCGLVENGNNQKSGIKNQKLGEVYPLLCAHWRNMTLEMQRLEEENNRIFIEAYGLQDELTPDVPISEITLTCNPHYRYGGDKSEAELESLLLVDTIKELISYAIGCMMGRYSLDQPGLIYAHSGNDHFWEIYHQKHNKPVPPQNKNHSCDSWSTFPPDQDGIIPITDIDWFQDDAINRFIEFSSVAWPKEHLEENLKFVSESLGPNRGESPRETISRYISTGFFKHHMKVYKKRPIYWLFASGKLRAFQCLVYLHRYNEGTLSRMRTEYVIPLQGKNSARIEQLSGDISAATSTAHRKKLERERDKLIKQQTELQTFDEKLRHYADQRISLDLDDGVKVNYGKFGDLLAEVKAVTGKKKE